MCGVCCRGIGGIVLQEHDIARLAAGKMCSRRDFCGHYTERRNGKTHLRVAGTGACVFALENGRCAVHAARPDICRAWPFYRANLEDPVSFAMARAYCPGISPSLSHMEFYVAGRRYLRDYGLARARSQREAPVALLLEEDEE